MHQVSGPATLFLVVVALSFIFILRLKYAWSFVQNCVFLLLLVGGETSAQKSLTSKFRRFEKRLNSFEKKLDEETSAIRGDLKEIVKLLSIKGDQHQTQEEIPTNNVLELIGQLTDLKTTLVDKSNALWRGFSNEKSSLRRQSQEVDQEVQDLNKSLSTELKDVGSRLVVLTSKFDQGIHSLDKKIDNVKGELSHVDHAVKNVNNEIATVKKSNHDIFASLRNEEQRFAVVPNSLETMIKRQSSFEDVIARIDARSNLMLKFGLQHWNVQQSGSSYYFVTEDRMDWEESKQTCEYFGAYLAEITHSDEIGYIRSMLNTDRYRTIQLWIGGNDIGEEGKWVWANSNSSVSPWSAKWGKGEPNGNTEENCLHVNSHDMYRSWNDAPCNYEAYALCEVSMEPKTSDGSSDRLSEHYFDRNDTWHLDDYLYYGG